MKSAERNKAIVTPKNASFFNSFLTQSIIVKN
jgi:hypothetical protein